MAEQILPDDLRYVYSPEELAAITSLEDTTIIEVTTPSVAIPLKTTVAELKEFILSGAGSGDMLAATYDPTNVSGDAFDMDNMVEGDTNKLVSSAEKLEWDAKLDYLKVIFSYSGETLTSTKTVAEIIAAITDNKQIIAQYGGIAVFITENITVGVDFVAFTFMDALSSIKIIGDGSGETDSWTLVEETIQQELESGTNIKTINNTSILGSGNITTPDTTYEASDFDIKDLTDSTNLRSTWSGKQNALTFGIADTNAVKIDAADVSDNDYARFTANGLEGRSTTELLDDIGGLSKQLVYPLSNDSYSGFTIAGVLYETVAFGEAVYFDGTKWRKLNCLTTLIDYKAGVCVQAGNADENTLILLYGTIRADSLYDFTAGYRLYSSFMAGQILSQVSTAVQNSYNVIPYILGSALDANTAFINPQFVEAQKMTGGSETSDPTTIANVTRNNQGIIKFKAAGITRSIAISQTTQAVITYLDLQNTTESDITVTFTPPSGKTIIKNYDSLVVAAGGHKLVRYWLVGTLLYIVDEDMTAGGTDSDEKVKYDASDTTAGYIADKFVAGTGISLSEGTGTDENKLVITNTAAGSGDMLASTYDPTSVAGDAFDMDNMIEGDTNLILTADERTKIGNALTYFTLTYYQAKPATCTTGETCFDTSNGKIYTATATDTWDSGVAASTSVLYVWQNRIYEFVTGKTLKPLSYGKKLEKSPTVTSNAFSWECKGERSKSYVSNNANTTCTVTPATGDTATEHSLLFTNSDTSNSHTISFAAASGFTLKMLATTLTIPASGFVELSVELYGTVCYIKYSIN